MKRVKMAVDDDIIKAAYRAKSMYDRAVYRYKRDADDDFRLLLDYLEKADRTRHSEGNESLRNASYVPFWA